MYIDCAIIKYSCLLMNRRMDIVSNFKTLSDYDKAELEWISQRMKLVRQVQLLSYSV